MAQDNVVKKPFQMPTPENTAGNESGVTQFAPSNPGVFKAPTDLNQTASTENMSAKYKYPQKGQDIPNGADNQYMA